MDIPVTQYKFPDGRENYGALPVSDDLGEEWAAVQDAGLQVQTEILPRTHEVHLTLSCPTQGVDVAMRVCPNNEAVTENLESLIRQVAEQVDACGGCPACVESEVGAPQGHSLDILTALATATRDGRPARYAVCRMVIDLESNEAVEGAYWAFAERGDADRMAAVFDAAADGESSRGMHEPGALVLPTAIRFAACEGA